MKFRDTDIFEQCISVPIKIRFRFFEMSGRYRELADCVRGH